MTTSTQPHTAAPGTQRADARPLPSSPPIPQLAGPTLASLALVLHRLGYDAAQDLTRTNGPAPLEESQGELLLLRKLFWRGSAVPATEAGQALSPDLLPALIDGGLLRRVGDGVRAIYQIQVYDGLFFIADPAGRDQPADLVLPIGPSGMYLAAITIRRQVGSALDLGCGCGIQSLLISRHATHVTATDINPRALALTRLNAALNGASNIETLEGSYFEPVDGRTFDLIVANLPYVITPENRLIYRDLGSTDDLPIRRNVEQVPEHLNEGGFGQLMLNWIHGAEQPWYEPISAWTTRHNADSWLIYSHSKTPEEYTRQWMTIHEEDAPEHYARVRDEWIGWYQAHNIQRLAFGVLSLRRRTASDNWRCSLRVERTSSGALGEFIRHLFANQDFLNGIAGPSDLLRYRLRPHQMTIEREGAGYVARTRRDFLVRQSIDVSTAWTITGMDEKRDLRSCIRRALGIRLWGRRQAVELISREIYQLMNLGMVEPAD